jgi:alpha-D-ribose 1-methylphosphonate 5-triphosphate synthase subunit PhnG
VSIFYKRIDVVPADDVSRALDNPKEYIKEREKNKAWRYALIAAVLYTGAKIADSEAKLRHHYEREEARAAAVADSIAAAQKDAANSDLERLLQ